MTHLATNPQSFKPLSAVATITHEVARQYGLSPDDILGSCKLQKIFEAKAQAYYLAFANTDYTTVQLGCLFHKDHTSILNGVAYYCAKNNIPVPRDARWARYEWWVRRLATKPPPPFRQLKGTTKKRSRAPSVHNNRPTWASQLAKEVRHSFR